ncbi:MAG: PEP-utilizing enzyme [Candidatus Magnetominusculus sp. LBB02]|nr:PEP-utilizing enzyme [Candidatus Magnetominusculus sp. LBB02]
MTEKAKSSRALQINIADYSVDVTIDPMYKPVQDVMARFHGLADGLTVYLKELCHPYKNWQYIVKETWTYALGYFYELTTHPDKGPEAAALYMDTIIQALICSAKDPQTATDAFSLFYMFTQKLIKDSPRDVFIEKYLPVINKGLGMADALPDERFLIVAKSHYRLNKLAMNFYDAVAEGSDFSAINSLITHYLRFTYSYWLTENNPKDWFAEELSDEIKPLAVDILQPISHEAITGCIASLDEIIANNNMTLRDKLKAMAELPGYGDIVAHFNKIPSILYQTIPDETLKHHYELIFLFHIMNTPGLSTIHEDTLREINRIIKYLIVHEDYQQNKTLINKTVDILKNTEAQYPATVLRCVLNMGKGVYESNNAELVHYYNHAIMALGFQTPDFRGISNDWQIMGNAAHIDNIRTYMELIRLNPSWSKTLLSSLIVNLSLGGVIIKDTDLFPRDITNFLNSDIRLAYNLVKQLMRLFPVYFNELGAEGQLRDISTRMDESCKRNDTLIHFLRKQSHVESSNKILAVVEAALEFWRTRDKELLKQYLPPDIYTQQENSGQYVDGVHVAITKIFEMYGLKSVGQLLSLGDDYLVLVMGALGPAYAADIEKVALAISFYKLLHQKYSADFSEIDSVIAQIHTSAFPKLDNLIKAISEPDIYNKLAGVLEHLLSLKDLIQSPKQFEVREDIYRKRHISTEIPSMYGSYHEVKFDALGLTFRLETLVNTLFEELVEGFDLSFLTRAALCRIYDYLKLFKQALIVDGIAAREFDRQLYLLETGLSVRGFTFSQFVDIFKEISHVIRNIVNDYFNNMHMETLKEILEILPEEKLLPKYRCQDNAELFNRVSEVFLRDTIASSLGLQSLDLFITRILATLRREADKIPAGKHHLLVTYNPDNAATSIVEPVAKVSNVIHMGNKGFNLMRMGTLGLNVPPGFLITTEVFKCRELFDIYEAADRNFRQRVDNEIAVLQRLTGREFGNPQNPLLVSVRSGSAISQPGMLDSYLNVGMNEAVANGMIAANVGREWFVWDCYRRFIQHYGMSFGLDRDSFDAIINSYKAKCRVFLKKEFTPAQMREIAFAYKDFVTGNGIMIEDNPKEQLYIAIRKVLDSWDTDKARSYRKIIGISDDWGTSVTVQRMVYGNIGQTSGSGVLFTHNPKLHEYGLRPWGDYGICVQGDDIVSGLVQTHAISLNQARREGRPVENSLEVMFPEVYGALVETARFLVEDRQWNPQDIEFTFEGKHKEEVYILQARDMEIREKQPEYTLAAMTAELSKSLLGHGIGVSGGAMAGRAVFTMEDIRHYRKAEPQTHLILIRRDTVPDDIVEVSASDGLLTARGGATSHAAIVAYRLGKTCVVGCVDMLFYEKQKRFVLCDRTVRSGDFITIDAVCGAVYEGKMEINI